MPAQAGIHDKRKNHLKKQGKKKELLFVNKKKQKNFDNFWPMALERSREAEQKFFASFFKKEVLASFLYPINSRKASAGIGRANKYPCP
jgi:hypothetical protein